MKAKEFLKENFSSLVKVCVLIIAFLLPILLLIFIWKNYFYMHEQLNDLIAALKDTKVQNVDLNALTKCFDDNAQFNFNIFISLIDIAIAVWLGLNIYNTLSKNEVKKLKDELSNTLNILNKKIESIDLKIYKLDKAFLISGEKELYRKVQYCKDLITKDPNSRENYNLLGTQYYISGDYKNALQSYEKAVEISEKYYIEADFNCCECLINLGFYNEAIQRLEKVLEHNQSDFEVYLLFAEAYRRKGEYENALKYNQKASILSSENYYVLNMYGSIYFNMGQLNDAENYFVQTLSKIPDFKEAHYYLSEIYKNSNPTQSAYHKDLSHGYIPEKP